MAYITKYNAHRITRGFDNNLPIPISHDYFKRPIGILSDEDIKRLLVYKILLQSPNDFIAFYYEKIKESYNYIFRSTPSFHKDINCEKLHSDFQNIKTPNSINNAGNTKKKEFDEWCVQNKRLYQTDVEAFRARMSMKFDIPITEIEIINKQNSGVEYQENYSLEELDYIIEQLLLKAKDYYYSSDKNKRIITLFRNKMYLRKPEYFIKFNNSGYTNEDVKEVLNYCYSNFIEKLIYYLQEWLRISFNPDLSFNGMLLEQLNFTNCKACYSDYISQIPISINLINFNLRVVEDEQLIEEIDNVDFDDLTF